MVGRLVAAGLLAFPAASAQAEPLQPTAKWVVDFDEAQCIAYREYGTREKPMTLVFKQPALGSVMQVAVLTKGHFSGEPKQVDGSIRFDDRPAVKIPALQWRHNRDKLPIRMINVPLKDFAAARTAKILRFEAGALQREFGLSDVNDLMKVMNVCVADLAKVWNVPAEASVDGKSGSVGRAAAISGGVAGLFRAEDYPAAAISNEQTGRVTFVVLVDEQGKVADCSIVETSGVAVLDSQACAIIGERAKFKPALDSAGNPRKDALIQTVRWEIG